MHTQISVPYQFENLRVTLDGTPDILFGTAQILADRDMVSRGTWCIGAIRVSGHPGSPSLKIRPESEVHAILRVALAAQHQDAIDDCVGAALEEDGGYVALFGERMPSVPASRHRARAGFYIPGSPVQDRAMSRTFAL